MAVCLAVYILKNIYLWLVGILESVHCAWILDNLFNSFSSSILFIVLTNMLLNLPIGFFSSVRAFLQVLNYSFFNLVDLKFHLLWRYYCTFVFQFSKHPEHNLPFGVSNNSRACDASVVSVICHSSCSLSPCFILFSCTYHYILEHYLKNWLYY